MNAYALLEPLLVGLIVTASSAITLRRALPGPLARLGLSLRQAGAPAWLADLCSQPAKKSGCASQCSSCSNCESGSPKNEGVIVLHRNKPAVGTHP